MKNVLEHNTCRILEDEEVLEHVVRLSEDNGGQIELVKYVKYGFDGSGLDDVGKTKHATEGSERDEGKIMTSHVTCLNMVAFVDDQCHIVYSNKDCNSSR